MNQKLVDIVTKKIKHPLYEKLLAKYPAGSGRNVSIEKLEEIRDAVFETLETIEKEALSKDVVIVEVSGGVVQSISSTTEIQVLVLDADIDKDNVDNKTINGETVIVSEHNVKPDQEYCLDILKQILNYEFTK